MKSQATKISLLVSGLFVAAGAYAQQSTTTDVGTINVEGQPGGTSTGLIQQEDTPKARSSVNRAYIDKQGATANPYQLINLLPGVNTYDRDGSGLFGGGLRVRGFNSDQLGFTIDGVPVNDSGDFAVFPQEYTDQENLCEIFVTQGSTDVEAPHVGASGGNIGIVTCAPEDKMRTRFSQTSGSHALSKTFVRYDTGKFLDDRAKFFISASHSEAEKFKGRGDAYRDHVDFKGRFDLGSGSYLTAGYLYNRAVTNNYRTLTKAQIDQRGKYFDFGTIAPRHVTPRPGVADDDRAATGYNVSNGILNASGAGINNGYYGFNLNPFKNYIATLKGHFQLAPNASVDVEPYLWYGYGTGGNQLQTQREANSPGTPAAQRGGGQVHGGVRDINGDGDTLDNVAAYESSITKTYRPGVTTKFNWQLDNHRLLFGYWYEKARHQQTAPYVRIDDNGNAEDIWLANPNQWLKNQDGTPANFRDWYTVNTAKSAFVQDNIALLQDKVNLQLGVRNSRIERNFRNSANQGTGGGADYEITRDYSKTLPNVGVTYRVTPEQSIFANAAKNFKAPANFVLSGLAQGGTFVNGVLTGFTLRDPAVVAETSNNFDVGYRFAGERLTVSGSVFYIRFKNRIASSFNPDTATSTDFNVGDSTSKGAEFESGYRLTPSLSLYGSLSYIKSEIKQDLQFSRTIALPTAGKEYPDTPNWLAGLGLQYQLGGWYAFGQAKYVGKRFSTLVNDDSLKPYTLVNLGTGYRFPSTPFFKSPTVRLNVYNAFSKDYLSLSSGSGSAFTNNSFPIVTPGGTKTAETPSFYVGSPRTFTVTLSSDF